MAMASPVKILFISFILTNLILSSVAQIFIGQYCIPERGNYTDGSSYQASLNSLLATFSTTTVDYGFYHSSAGGEVTGTGLCRGDIGPDACRGCMNTSSHELKRLCPNSKEAIIYYEICTLRYANRSILGKWEAEPYHQQPNAVDFWDVNGSTEALTKLLRRLQGEASGGNRRKYATGEEKGFETIYGGVQCSPDITEEECRECLDEIFKIIPEHMKGKRGGKAMAPSCNFRFEIYSFYQSPLPDAPSPSPSGFPPFPPTINATTTGNGNGKGRNSSTSRIILIGTVVPSVGLALIVTLGWIFWKRVQKGKDTVSSCVGDDYDHEEITSFESIQFNLSTIMAATSDFSNDNRLGRGGFGEVYKGLLSDGKQIAVKRLSRKSDQGEVEFKNEVLLLAKLQHRNLVKLLGFCLEGDERLLIYEFMPMCSLDHFIFDPINRAQLEWDKRYKIIEGIARGLLYLHEDSRLRIIHCDLKASNILLDANMNPKISDFGMAKLFMVDQTHVKASKISGTYGYMSPEYAYKGHISVKSDVYSFGVLVLEIVSGQKICVHKGEELEHLVSYAWRKWREENALDIVDPTLVGVDSKSEIMRCIQIALLCVQESADSRPTMGSIVSLFNSYSCLPLSTPLQPGFLIHSITKKMEKEHRYSRANEVDHGQTNSAQFSTNRDSITGIYPR